MGMANASLSNSVANENVWMKYEMNNLEIYKKKKDHNTLIPLNTLSPKLDILKRS